MKRLEIRKNNIDKMLDDFCKFILLSRRSKKKSRSTSGRNGRN